MIKELEPMETPNGDNILYVKMNEAIRALNAIEAASTSTNSSSPKCPAPVPCGHIMSDGGCGKVPKCFSRWGTSGN
jgi:hypothetical protein